MSGNLSIRKVRTGSGAIAVQVIRYRQGKRIILRHIGSSHAEEELAVLCQEAEVEREQLSLQPSLFLSQKNLRKFYMRSTCNYPQLRIILLINL